MANEMSIEEKGNRFFNSNLMRKRRRFDHEYVKAHVFNKLNILRKYIPITKKTKVLEIGAGDGYFSYYLDKICDLTATDVNKVIFSKNPARKKVICDASSMPFKDNFFDLVLEIDVLHHVDNPEIILSEMKRVTKKHIVLFEPNAENFVEKIFSFLLPYESGSRRFTSVYFRTLIKSNGLKIVKLEYAGGLILPNGIIPLNISSKFAESNLSIHNIYRLAICEK